MIEICIVLVVVGVILWAVNTYVPLAAPVKMILNAVVMLALIFWLLRIFGLIHHLPVRF